MFNYEPYKREAEENPGSVVRPKNRSMSRLEGLAWFIAGLAPMVGVAVYNSNKIPESTPVVNSYCEALDKLESLKEMERIVKGERTSAYIPSTMPSGTEKYLQNNSRKKLDEAIGIVKADIEKMKELDDVKKDFSAKSAAGDRIFHYGVLPGMIALMGIGCRMIYLGRRNRNG